MNTEAISTLKNVQTCNDENHLLSFFSKSNQSLVKANEMCEYFSWLPLSRLRNEISTTRLETSFETQATKTSVHRFVLLLNLINATSEEQEDYVTWRTTLE